jgi:hypothetical protein
MWNLKNKLLITWPILLVYLVTCNVASLILFFLARWFTEFRSGEWPFSIHGTMLIAFVCGLIMFIHYAYNALKA